MKTRRQKRLGTSYKRNSNISTQWVPFASFTRPSWKSFQNSKTYTNILAVTKYSKLRQKYALGWIKICNFQQNLKAEENKDTKTEPTPKRKSWQPKILAIRGSKQSCLLVNSTADMHICNNQRLMINFKKNFIKVGESNSESISPSKRKVKIRLIL